MIYESYICMGHKGQANGESNYVGTYGHGNMQGGKHEEDIWDNKS